MLRMVQAKGAGYAMSRQAELEIMQQVAHTTGLLTRTLQLITPVLNLVCSVKDAQILQTWVDHNFVSMQLRSNAARVCPGSHYMHAPAVTHQERAL